MNNLTLVVNAGKYAINDLESRKEQKEKLVIMSGKMKKKERENYLKDLEKQVADIPKLLLNEYEIGTNDLDIMATLKDGKVIKVFENGKFSKERLNNI